MFGLRLIGVFCLISLLLSCGVQKGEKEEVRALSVPSDPFVGHYYNSSTECLLKSICIEKQREHYVATLHYGDSSQRYEISWYGEEMVFELLDGNEMHLFWNGNELRVYRVMDEGFQPEDIEWTFYRSSVLRIEDSRGLAP